MFFKKIKFILIVFLLYQNPLHSKSNSFTDFDSKNLSKYFSCIVAFENKENSIALEFFNSSKVLVNKHDPYLKRYIYSLVLESKVSQAINVIKNNKDKSNTNFFDAYLLLILDSLKKNDFEKAKKYLGETSKFVNYDRFYPAITGILKNYIHTFYKKEILYDKANFGNISLISQAFQRCYLNNNNTRSSFLNLVNNPNGDYTRYKFFYANYLIENDKIDEVKDIFRDIEFINSTLLLSQSKIWVKNNEYKNFTEIFSCKNHNDIISEFLFLMSNLYSSEED